MVFCNLGSHNLPKLHRVSVVRIVNIAFSYPEIDMDYENFFNVYERETKGQTFMEVGQRSQEGY
jgi:hypothetical protein